MSPSVQHTSEQLKEIIQREMNHDKGAREVRKQVDGNEVLEPHNAISVFSTVLNTIDNEFDYECLDETVRLLNAHPNHQSTEDSVPGHKYSIPRLPTTKFLPHQYPAICFVVSRWICNAGMQGELVADEMSLGMTFHLGCSGNAVQIGD
jgi:hypothetical protein